MPVDWSKYPKEWKTVIRPAILERAHDCCEECGVKNYSVGARDVFGEWHNKKDIDGMNSDCGYHLFKSFNVKIIKIVLTIAHLDNNVKNNDYSNLKALCQKCHLSRDGELHRANARATIEKKKHLQRLF